MPKPAYILIICCSLFLLFCIYINRTHLTKNKIISTNINKKNKLGGSKNLYGCIPSSGYTWCESKNKCIREWEEDCDIMEGFHEKGLEQCDGKSIDENTENIRKLKIQIAKSNARLKEIEKKQKDMEDKVKEGERQANKVKEKSHSMNYKDRKPKTNKE